MSVDEEARAHKLAASQSRFRRTNERLERAAYSHRFEAADRLPFLCECADPGCFEAVWLSMAEYERVRAHPSRFVLVAGHEDPETAPSGSSKPKTATRSSRRLVELEPKPRDYTNADSPERSLGSRPREAGLGGHVPSRAYLKDGADPAVVPLPEVRPDPGCCLLLRVVSFRLGRRERSVCTGVATSFGGDSPL